jgi:hypothetical protein
MEVDRRFADLGLVDGSVVALAPSRSPSLVWRPATFVTSPPFDSCDGRCGKQFFDLGPVQHRGRLESDEPPLVAAAEQEVVRIGKRRSVHEVQIDTAAIDHERLDGVGLSLRRSEADRECTGIVLDQLDGSRQTPAETGSRFTHECSDRRIEPFEQFVQLSGCGIRRHGCTSFHDHVEEFSIEERNRIPGPDEAWLNHGCVKAAQAPSPRFGIAGLHARIIDHGLNAGAVHVKRGAGWAY